MKSEAKSYINILNDKNHFKNLVLEHFPNFNKDNVDYLNELFEFISTKEIKGKVSFINECSYFFKTRRSGKGVSKISKNYWLSLGWSEEYAKLKVSSLQKSRSVLSLEYWINKGYTSDQANLKIKEYQSNNAKKKYEKYTKKELRLQSVWSKDFWLKKGLSNAEADYEVNKRNYGKREFWTSDLEYEEIKKIIGKKTSNFIKENPEKYKSFFGSVSKEEILFFEKLKLEICNVNHKQFIINVKESLELDKGIIKYDGYLKTNDGIILIEYDGLYWHNQAYDELKDMVALDIRNDIIGIIRISCNHFKTNSEKTIKLIKYAIEEIKSKKSNRIKIY